MAPEGLKETIHSPDSKHQRSGPSRAALDSFEEARFETVVFRSSERLINMLEAIFLDRQLADDAAQEAYVQLYLHWDEVGHSPDPEAWLYRVALNRCKDYRRRISRNARLLRRLVAATPLGVPQDAGWESSDDFTAILRKLPMRQRVAAALFYQADMSIAEISHLMGISEGAVNSHLNRARRALKKILEAAR